MKISSEELGKILVAFGKSLLQSDEGYNESLPPLEPTNAVVTGAFETEMPIETPTAEQSDTTKARIAELSQELATLQNQSGLDLKPIKL